ncbi:hypothetical protein ACLM5H_07420 [Fredinandcohnia humi]
MKVQDHRKIHKNIYKVKPNVIEVIEVPELQYIVTEGTGPKNVYEMHDGDPLWSISRVTNRLKDMTKNELEYKFTLMPLEVIWTRNEGESMMSYSWNAMMQVPDIITQEMFTAAIHELEQRKRSVRVPLRLEKWKQNTCVQTLHVGPYTQIEETIDLLKRFCDDQGFQIANYIREIYINAPFCNPPEKLQTIVRAEIVR